MRRANPTPNADWTLLVYFSGEKDLAEAMIVSLKDMYRVCRPPRCHVVVQFEQKDGQSKRFWIGAGGSEGTGSGSASNSEVQRALNYRDHDGRLRRLAKDIRSATESRSASQGDAIESFVTWGIEEHPSEHYLVVLSGHGSGVEGRSSSEDGFAPGAMRTAELGPTFERIQRRTGRTVDVLGMDACYMSMCEVGWELAGSVRFLVASEGLTPQYGWPYHRILELFRDSDCPAPEDVATGIASRYLRYRADFDLTGQSVDLAACALDGMGRLGRAVSKLCRAMIDRLSSRLFGDALLLSHWKAQSYKSAQYTDLWDFCHLLQRHSRDEAIRRRCKDVQTTIASPRDGVVRKSIYHGPDYQHSHGLSVYFPWAQVSPSYTGFGFAQATGWYDFVTLYVTATRRELRGA